MPPPTGCAESLVLVVCGARGQEQPDLLGLERTRTMFENETTTVIEFVDVTCPSCAAEAGEPCSKWCDDDYVGTVKQGRRHGWDDGEQW